MSPMHTQGTDESHLNPVSQFTGISQILKFELSGLDMTPTLLLPNTPVTVDSDHNEPPLKTEA